MDEACIRDLVQYVLDLFSSDDEDEGNYAPPMYPIVLPSSDRWRESLAPVKPTGDTRKRRRPIVK